MISPLSTALLLVTLTPVSPYTTTPIQIYNNNAILDHKIALAVPDRDGKRAVLHFSSDNTTSPLCDDGFTDLDATVLCGLVGMNRGRRTRKKTNKKFYGTQLSCSNKPGTVKSMWQGGMKFKYLNATEPGLCTLELYTEQSLPCSSTQALAIFCWGHDVSRAIDVAIDSIKLTKKKWSFVFKMFDFKHGRWFNVFEQALGSQKIIESDFFATQCGETPPNYSLKIDEKTKQFAFTAKFVDDCDECVVMSYLDFQLFKDYVCPDYLYSLDAEYKDGLEDANLEFEDKN